MWYFNDNPTAITTGSILVIPNVDIDHEGQYECRGIDQSGSYFRARANLIVHSM